MTEFSFWLFPTIVERLYKHEHSIVLQNTVSCRLVQCRLECSNKLECPEYSNKKQRYSTNQWQGKCVLRLRMSKKRIYTHHHYNKRGACLLSGMGRDNSGNFTGRDALLTHRETCWWSYMLGKCNHSCKRPYIIFGSYSISHVFESHEL